MKKWVLIVSVFLLWMWTSHQDQMVGSDCPRVTVVLKTMSSEYWKFVEAGVMQACADLGVQGTVVGPASEAHILEQVHLIEDVLTQHPDALIISPIVPSTVISVLNRLSHAAPPVFFLDTDADWPAKAAFVGIDNQTVGRTGGKALAHLLQAGDQVALISGALGNPATDDRIKGAKEELHRAKMIIVAEQSGDSDKAKAMSAMENILQTHPDVKGVFAANDEMALGALRAVQEKRLSIRVIGTDGTMEALRSIKSEGLTGTVAQNPYRMGYKAVEAALKKMKGQKINQRIDSGIGMITQENVLEEQAFLENIRK